MSSRIHFNKQAFQERIQNAVRSGNEIRQRVAEEVARVVRDVDLDAEGLSELARAVMDGAQEGLDESLANQSASALREVADGLGDGLAAAAEALQLTLQEAKGSGQRFAQEDLDKIIRDFQTIKDLFVGTLSEAGGKLRGEVASQAQAFRQHTERAYQRVKPAVESALKAAREHPVALGKETVKAGLGATTHAAGTLFTEIGKRLERIGSMLRKSDQP